uniref:G_PROTEIN_RECEP_F1_2 domain-containing protein n=1 Tax=Trichuris muris TaxID=70415 RepID=A0A5S6QI45_TRIMR
MDLSAELALCQCTNTSAWMFDFSNVLYNDSEQWLHWSSVPKDATRLIIGVTILTISILALTIQSHVLLIILCNRMWRLSFFFLWFVSQGVADFLCLLTNVYGCLTIVFPDTFFHCGTANAMGYLSEAVYHVALPHYFVLAFVRYLSIRSPIHFAHYARRTVVQAVSLWLVASAVAAAFLFSEPSNSIYFHPLLGSWVLACPKLYKPLLDVYWTLLPSLCILTSLVLYSLSWRELKRQRTYQYRATMHRSSSESNKRAENNVVAIGLTMTIVLLVENAFWRLSVSRLFVRHWWSGYSLTLAQVLRCGSNPVLLLIISSEVMVNSVFRSDDRGSTVDPDGLSLSKTSTTRFKQSASEYVTEARDGRLA